jgi:endo-1,4-beta-xylanase
MSWLRVVPLLTLFACGGGDMLPAMTNGIPPAGGDDASAGAPSQAAADPSSRSVPDAGLPGTLRAVAATGSAFQHVGAATSIGVIDSDATYAATLAREFDSVTPENDMKWGLIEPGPNRWNWAPAEGLVAWASAHGMRIKGHTLVWHQQLPSWMSSMTDAQAIKRALIEHITTEVAHFKGRLVAWDVVNEAVLDDGSGYRPDVFLTALGPDYVKLAFDTAHAADPSALLIYNDFGAEGRGSKSDFVYKMLEGLRATGTPVGGVGLQMHIDGSGNPSPADIRWNVQRLEGLGLRVNISEMDVRMTNIQGTQQLKVSAQRDVYHDVVAVCATEPECDAVTFWGFTDAVTWVDSFFGPNNYPLLFDGHYEKKPAYFGVLDAMLHR